MLTSLATNPPRQYPKPGSLPEKDWTVLYVFNGDNDLKENTSHQFMDIVEKGAPENSYVASFCARGDLEWAPGNIGRKLAQTVSNLFRKKKDVEVPSDWVGNRVFVVDPKGGWSDPVAAPEGEVHQGATISEFLKWGIKSFPSKHVAVVFSTHGDAHNGVLMNAKGKEMPLPELRETLEGAAEEHGRELDLVAFESCNMAEAEVAYELHDTARAMVASPTVLFGVPWNHPEALEKIAGADDGLQAAVNIVETAKETFNDGTPTISAVDLDKMPQLKDTLDRFSQNLLESDIGESTMERMIYNARSYGRAAQGYSKPQRELIDLYGFCREVLTNNRVEKGPATRSAQEVCDLLPEIVPNHMDRQDGYGEGHGLSIFTPTMRGLFKPLGDKYPKLKMSLEGDWDDFLAKR
jgi:hypothetical protein